MDETLTKTLNSLTIEVPISHGWLHMFPLLAGGFVEEDIFLLLDDGIQNGTLRVEELNEGGSVPELRVTRRSLTGRARREAEQLERQAARGTPPAPF